MNKTQRIYFCLTLGHFGYFLIAVHSQSSLFPYKSHTSNKEWCTYSTEKTKVCNVGHALNFPYMTEGAGLPNTDAGWEKILNVFTNLLITLNCVIYHFKNLTIFGYS